MATPTPKSRQSKTADRSQESHGSSAVSHRHAKTASEGSKSSKEPAVETAIQRHSKTVSESSKSLQSAVVDIASSSKQTQLTTATESRQVVSKSSADGISEKSAPQHPVEKPEAAPRERKESSKSSHGTAVAIESSSKQSQSAPIDAAATESKPLKSESPADSISEKSAPQQPVEKPEPEPREKHRQDQTPSKLSNAAERNKKENQAASQTATPRTSRRSGSEKEKPTAAPRSQSRRDSPEKRSSSALTEGAANTDIQPPSAQSKGAVVPAWHSSSGKSTPRELMSRERRSDTDKGPFSSTPSELSLGPENEGFAEEKKAVSSKQRASASSNTARLPDTLKSSAGEPPTELPAEPITDHPVELTTKPSAEPTTESPVEPTIGASAELTTKPPIEPPTEPPIEPTTKPSGKEQCEEAHSEEPQNEQPVRIPWWKRSLATSKHRSADAQIKKETVAPLLLPLSAKYKDSFAYKTVRDRLPVILTKVIDTVFRDRMEIERVLGPEAREETKLVVGRLAKLRNEMVTNKPMTPIEDDFEDAEIWNNVLNEYTSKNGREPHWYEAPWLYIETYFYRRIFEAFRLTAKLRDYDPFSKLKQDALYGSFNAVRALCDILRWNTPRDATLETLQQTTYRLIELSLWGNRCDLSLSSGTDTSTQAGSLQLTERLRPYIISSHVDRLMHYLCRLRERNFDGEVVHLHCMLDNSGYELATDLVLLDFLHETQYVNRVTIHVKAIPWFVSDVTRRDLFWTLREMEDSDHTATQALSERCQHRIMQGVWYVMDDVFWTQSFDYAEMATRRPDLYNLLQSADLLLFKGDLNYRKLVGDLSWNPTVPFKQALRGFEPTFVCALRTLKADTVAGIDPVILDEVAQRSPNWMVTGEYAVIQCAGEEHMNGPSLAPTPESVSSPKQSGTATPVHESTNSASVLHTAASVHKRESSDMHQEARKPSGTAPEQVNESALSGSAASATAASATAGSKTTVCTAAAASSSTIHEVPQQSSHSSVPDDTKKHSGNSSRSAANDAPPHKSK